MRKFTIRTSYSRVVVAENLEEAENMALKELQGMDGLGGEWVWNEDVEGSVSL